MTCKFEAIHSYQPSTAPRRPKPIEWSQAYEVLEGSNFWTITGYHPFGSYSINWKVDPEAETLSMITLMLGTDTIMSSYINEHDRVESINAVLQTMRAMAATNLRERFENGTEPCRPW